MHKTKGVLDALVNSRPIANALIKDYYDIFILALEDFKITDEEYKAAVQNEFDEIIVKKIEMLRPLRDDFIIFFEGIIRYSSSIDIESLQNFLSRFISFISTIRLSPSQRRFFSDQFEFFAYELFLYIVAIMIDNEKFSELSELLMSPLLEQNEANGMIAAPNFVVFRYYVESLNDFRNKRLGLRRSSMTADLIKERADNTKYPFHKLAEMDLLLYLISLFIPPEIKKLLNHPWFPELGVYGRLPIKIFQRSISKKYFNKVKCILNVQDKSEIVTALKSPEVESFIRRVQSQLYYFDSVDSLLNLQKIATIP